MQKNSNQTAPQDEVPTGKKELSDTEIKHRLKQNTKSDLIKIIKNLANKLDEAKEENDAHKKHIKGIKEVVEDIGSAIEDYGYYDRIINKINEKVDEDV